MRVTYTAPLGAIVLLLTGWLPPVNPMQIGRVIIRDPIVLQEARRNGPALIPQGSLLSPASTPKQTVATREPNGIAQVPSSHIVVLPAAPAEQVAAPQVNARRRAASRIRPAASYAPEPPIFMASTPPVPSVASLPPVEVAQASEVETDEPVAPAGVVTTPPPTERVGEDPKKQPRKPPKAPGKDDKGKKDRDRRGRDDDRTSGDQRAGKGSGDQGSKGGKGS